MFADTVPVSSARGISEDSSKLVERAFKLRFGHIKFEDEAGERVMRVDPRYFEGHELKLFCRLKAGGARLEVVLEVRPLDRFGLAGDPKDLTIEHVAGASSWNLRHDLPPKLHGQACKEGRIPLRLTGLMERDRAVFMLQRLVAFCADLPMIVRDGEYELKDHEPFDLVTQRS